ncbi:acyl-[acyl-carrier-protein]-UDP-N-acetylglucosamine O-acyltransferase, partial [Batrachochytrium salamandrivorans]
MATIRAATSAMLGPYAVVGDLVRLGKGVVIGPHAVLLGNTTIGNDTKVHSFACVGDLAQNKKSELVTCVAVGEQCVIREHVTVHCGTHGPTTIGNRVWLLAGSHVGHDCEIGNDALVSNASQLAGHVRVGQFANIGGLCGIQQFCVIGEGAMVGGGSMVDRHVPPYSLVVGNRAQFRGINIRGLKRRHIPPAQISSLVRTAKRIYTPQGEDPHQQALIVLSELVDDEDHQLAKQFAS